MAGWLPLLLLLLLAPPRVGGCPARCECAPQSHAVDCARRRLATVPEGVPADTVRLALAHNRIRCLGPGELGALGALEELDLSDNALAHVEPTAFAGLGRLRELRLAGNLLRLLPPGAFGRLPSLARLDLSRNQLVALLDGAFLELRALRRLDLGRNQLVFLAPRAFAGLVALRELNLEHGNLTALPPDGLGPLPALTELRLGHLPVEGLEGAPFRLLSGLRSLDIAHWPRLGGLGAASLQGLNLSWLAVTHCNLSAVPAAALRLQAHLAGLDLSHNPLRALPRAAFRALQRLRELHLAGARLAAVEPLAFLGLRQLRLLNLSDNRLATLEEAAFPSVNSLETLRLDGNPLVCDCRLLWVAQRRKTLDFDGRPPACAAPDGAPDGADALRRLPDALLFQLFECRAPRILERRLQRLEAAEGQPVRLTCRAEGRPEPAVFWLGPGRRPLPGPEPRARLLPGGTLELAAARPEDSGAYTCVATNAGGNDTYFASLRVQPAANASLGEAAANATRPAPARAPLDLTAVLVSAAMGCITFLGVVLFCFVLLFLWSRGRGQRRGHLAVEYSFRKADGAHAGTGQGGTRRFNMKMI